MDFDSIISFFLILIIFVLPSILKLLKDKKKQKTAPVVSHPSQKLSFFEKIGEKIQQFVEELEQQSQLENSPAVEDHNVWDDLTADMEISKQEEPLEEREQKKVQQKVQQPFTDNNIALQKRLKPKKEKSLPIYVFKSSQLQNAVIWSEILSKPIALRDKFESY